MLSTNAIFERKREALDTQPCVIEAIETMDNERFEEFADNLLTDYPFISDRKEDMFIDSAGVIHGLLALNEESGDGILIDSEGYDYARYTSFMPNAKEYIDAQIRLVADQMIKDASENSAAGAFVLDMDEASDCYGISLKENNGIRELLLKELQSRQLPREICVENNLIKFAVQMEHSVDATMPESKISQEKIIDFLTEQAELTDIWPWFVSVEEMIDNPQKLSEVQQIISREKMEEGCDTDCLFKALTDVFGENPMLSQTQSFGM